MRRSGRRVSSPAWGERATSRAHPPGRAGGAAFLVCVLAWACALGACEEPSHENIDRWMRTEKGPGKIEQALRDPALAADLRAHAGQNLIRMENPEAVQAAFEDMAADQRQAVLGKLVPRLWDDARIEGEMTRPSALQIGAKDALHDLRPFADQASREAIDDYLVEWLTGGYYAGRSQTGRARGAAIIQAAGPRAAPRVLAAVRALVAAPPDASGARPEIEAELLVGLAVTGSPEAVALLLDLAGLADRDPALPGRALSALYAAYVDNGQRFDLAGGQALVPHLDRLAAMVQAPARGNALANDIIDIIAAAGAPACIAPLIGLLAVPLRSDDHLWVIGNAAVRCGKTRALVPVAEALPRARGYEARKLRGALWEPMAALDDADGVAAQARVLLQSESWVARITGVELLGQLARRASAAADAERVRALAGDRTVLRGWWGDQDSVPRGERKSPPRLGERAAEVAKQLALLASSSDES